MKGKYFGYNNCFAGQVFIPGYLGDGHPATVGALWAPTGLAVDKAGNVYIADMEFNTVRRVNTAGIISTYAGVPYHISDGCFFSGDGGLASAAKMCNPRAIAVDSIGNLYICDAGNNRIRKVDATGVITTIAGHSFRGYSGDGGPATAAELGGAAGVAVDNMGETFIADAGYNNVIRKINASGIISTYAGNGISGYAGDGGPAVWAELNGPGGLAVDHSNMLYIADGVNSRIRKLSAPNAVTVVNKSHADVNIYPNPAQNAPGAYVNK
jgi:NHL repeat-containing protein